jgi:hypothetical protein
MIKMFELMCNNPVFTSIKIIVIGGVMQECIRALKKK